MNGAIHAKLAEALSSYKSYIYWCLLVALLPIGSVIAYTSAIALHRWIYQGKHSQSSSGDSPLSIPEQDLNLGRVYETNALTHQFRVTNVTNQPVTIARFLRTCECLGITPDAEVTIQPQDTKTFGVRLKLLSGGRYASPLDGEPFRVRFSAVYSTEDQAEQVEDWTLNCVIVPTIRFSQPVIRIGTQSQRQALIEQSLDLEAIHDIGSIDCEAPDHWAVQIVQEQSGSSSQKFRINVRSHGKLIRRQVEDVLRLTPLTLRNEQLPTKELRIVGDVVRDIVAFPEEIHYGLRRCGTAAREVVCLRSLTNGKFIVRTVTSVNKDLEISCMGAETMNCLYSFEMRFTKPGDQQAIAEFVIQEEDGTEYPITISIRYQGSETF